MKTNIPTAEINALRKIVLDHIKTQGYRYQDGKMVSNLTPRERMLIRVKRPDQLGFFVDNEPIDPDKIDPRLISISNSQALALSRQYWNMVTTTQVGRCFSYALKDNYHQRLMGILMLMSPLLYNSARSSFLGLGNLHNQIDKINCSLEMFRCGALPGYNEFGVSRLMATVSVSNEIKQDYKAKYGSELLYVTTMGAFGKTPIYDRHRINDHKVSWFMGYTVGEGFMHLGGIYGELVTFGRKYNLIKQQDAEIHDNPSRSIHNILRAIGLIDVVNHGIKRGVYLLTTCRNLMDSLHKDAEPIHIEAPVKTILTEWRANKKGWKLPEKTYTCLSCDQSKSPGVMGRGNAFCLDCIEEIRARKS